MRHRLRNVLARLRGREVEYPAELLKQEEVLRDHLDQEYYLAANPDVRESGMDPVRHYVREGWREGRNPAADFNTSIYLALNEDVRRDGINPFYHYIIHGRDEGRLAGEGGQTNKAESEFLRQEEILREHIDEEYYLATNPDVRESGADPVRHFVREGWRERRNPTADFNTTTYLALNEDVERDGINPFYHYVIRGRDEGRPGGEGGQAHAAQAEAEFLRQEDILREHIDQEYYLATNPDVRESGADPVRHFVREGWREGRNPTADFNTNTYLALNEDVERDGINPFYHYVIRGRDEGRPGGEGGRTDAVEAEFLKQEEILREHLDQEYYLATNPDVRESGMDPVRHYVREGWREGRNPAADFNTSIYLALNEDVRRDGINPFYHYIIRGRDEGRAGGKRGQPNATEVEFLRQEELLRDHIDKEYYLATNPDVRQSGADPVRHFVRQGWREGRNPTADFSMLAYLAFNEDVLRSGVNPFYHYITRGRAEDRPGGRISSLRNDYLWSRAPHRMQDITFPRRVERAEALFVIIVPEHNTMSGGIYSFLSIAKAAYDIRHKHPYEVVVMTRPNKYDLTYLRQSNFRNSEDVFRFEQITRCERAKRVYLNIPEYAAPDFIASLPVHLREYLLSRERVYINILNQNVELMPEKDRLENLRGFAHELTQSVAHHAYFSQEHADRYDLPTLLLPAYTDLSAYERIGRSEKEKLIIYSPDEIWPHREPVIKALQENLPDYRLQEIRDITFEEFMSLATRCMFSISFGEGFDGYVAQPIHQGGIGLAVYREEYFPSRKMRDFANVFSSGQDMIDNIVSRIRLFERDDDLYRETNKAMMNIYESLYSKNDYVRRIEKLIRREFEYFPRSDIQNDKVVRLA
jgi:hypothetical protein